LNSSFIACSLGASLVTRGLGQRPGTIAVIDLFCWEEASCLDKEAAEYDVILKYVVNTKVLLDRQIEHFRPDRLVPVTRNIDDLTRSLTTKLDRDLGGSLETKVTIYQNLLLRGLSLFDEVVSYERFAAHAPEIGRTSREVVEFGNSWSALVSQVLRP
jgi:hypothetical protein